MPPVLLAAAEPDLFAAIPPDRRVRAAAASSVDVLRLAAGRWDTEGDPEPHAADFGLLLLEGLLLRRLSLGGRCCVEMLGAGDILQPWAADLDETSLPASLGWTAHADSRLAVLDVRFAARMAPYPEVAAALMGRMLRRTRWLALQLAIVNLPRLQERLRVVLWYVADRWGRVTPDGVLLPLPLTHELLGQLAGARRPAVTTAIGALQEEGSVTRRSDGTWLLTGPAPDAESL